MNRIDIAICASFAMGLILGGSLSWIILHARIAAWKRVARRNPVVQRNTWDGQ